MDPLNIFLLAPRRTRAAAMLRLGPYPPPLIEISNLEAQHETPWEPVAVLRNESHWLFVALGQFFVSQGVSKEPAPRASCVQPFVRTLLRPSQFMLQKGRPGGFVFQIPECCVFHQKPK